MPTLPRSFPSFWWKVLLALGLVMLGDILVYQRELYAGHIGFLTFAILLCLIAGQTARLKDSRTWAGLIFAALYCIALLIDPGPLPWLLFWIAATIAAMLASTARFDDGWLWFQRLGTHALVVPFAPLIDLHKVARARRRRRRFGFSAGFGVLALPIAGSLVIIGLFSAANPIIADLFASLSLPELTPMTIMRIAIWGAMLLMVWSLLRPRLFRPLIPTFDGSGDLPLPGVSVASVRLSLILFNLLFAVQNLLDLAYLWGMMPLPEGTTLAGYAHRGAYPLIVTALLAAAFVLVTLRPGSSLASAPAIRGLLILWIGQNIFLVASSILRTLDYIDIYLLTSLRISALAWMALVALGLALICWRMLRAKSASWLINTNLAAGGLVLTLFCFIDAGALAAQWNVRHAREVGGRGVALDLCYLSRLDDAALLPLIELEGRPLPPAFRLRVQAVRTHLQQRLERSQADGGWTWRGAWRLRAATSGLARCRRCRSAAGRAIVKARSFLLLHRPWLHRRPPHPFPRRRRLG